MAKTELILETKVEGVSQAEGDLGKLNNSLGKSAEGFKKMGAAMAAIGAAGLLVMKDFLGATMESEKAQTQLATVLKSTGGAAGLFIEDLNAQAQALQRLTIYDDEAINSTQALLLTFTNIKGGVFQEATDAVLDMSTALGQDLKSSSIQLGKALQDPINGITALKRVGVNFSEAQKGVIEGLVNTGKTAEAQRLILAELRTEFGGSAVAAGKTLAGSLAILSNRFGDVKEKIGEGMIPVIEFFKKILDKLLSVFENMSPGMQKTIGLIIGLTTVFALIAAPILLLIGFLPSLAAGFGLLGISVGSVLLPLGLIMGAIVLLYEAWTNNWGGIQEKTQVAVAYVSGLLSSMKEWFMTEFGEIYAIAMDTWNKIKADWIAVWQVYGEEIKMGLSVVKALFLVFWDTIKFGFKLAWEAVKLAFGVAWDIFSGLIKTALLLLQGDWEGAWNAFAQIFIDIWERIKNALKGVWGAIKEYITGVINDIITSMQKLIDKAAELIGKLPGINITDKIGKAFDLKQYFADGGIVKPIYAQAGMMIPRGTDTVPAMLSPGELILNKSQQQNLAGQLSGQNIQIHISGIFGSDAVNEIGDALVSRLSRTFSIPAY